MRHVLVFGLSVRLAFSFSDAFSASPLEAYQWENRLLLIFSPTASHPDFIDIERELAASSCQVGDRDLVVGTLINKTAGYLDGKSLSKAARRSLREIFGIRSSEFRLLLIGKDGGEKFNSGAAVPLSKIFDRIDGMSMRRQEIRTRGRNCDS